jgi:ankyrin repeat protein
LSRVRTSHIKNDTAEIIHFLKNLNLDSKLSDDVGGDVAGDQVDVQGPDPRMKYINFALTSFLETTSTAAGSPNQSPWASPKDVGQISSFSEDLNHYDDHASDFARAPTLTREDSETEIRQMLAKEPAHTYMNEDGQTALHLAAMQDEYLTRIVLEHGLDINIRNLDGETPLMCAVNVDNNETVLLLLKNHAEVNAADEKQQTCLHLAASKDKSGSMTQLLLRRHADTEFVDAIGLTPLLVAAFSGNDVVTRKLLQHGAKQQGSDLNGFTALHYATMQANHAFMSRLLDPQGPDFEAFYEPSIYNIPTQPTRDTIFKRRALIVRMLLEYGADIRVSRKGFTPLQIAAITAQELIVNALLEKGASAQGVSVICAYWGLSPETVELLLEKGADINITDMRWHKPALTWHAEVGSPSTVEILLRHGASVQHQDVQGSSALHYASANARTESVKLLLKSGANPNLQDNEGKTPLTRLTSPPTGRFYLAGRWWNPSPADRKDTAVLLFKAGCDPSIKDVHGRSAIHYGASNGYLGVLEVIVERGGDSEILDENGSTPLERAERGGHVDVVRLLKREKFRKRK